MHLALTDAQESLRQDLRGYYARLLDPHTQALLADHDSYDATMRQVVKQMAADGWLGIGWPTEWGGQGRGHIDQWIFFDESMRAGAPVPMLTINTVGPTLMEHGTQEQKERFLPAILRGEIHFCIGYSESDAGTDLASLSTRAVLAGDDLVINGTKLWTSYGDTADYCWLAVRTNPDVNKHRGRRSSWCGWTPRASRPAHLSYLASTRSPRCTTTTYGPAGQRDRGPRQRLVAHDRPAQPRARHPLHARHGRQGADRGAALGAGRPGARRATGHRPGVGAAQPGAGAAGFEFLRLQNWKVAWDAERRGLDVAAASTTKVFGTELYLDACRLLMEVIGQAAYLKKGFPATVLASRLEAMYRSLVILTFGGGVNEVQRDLITVFGMGMPMVKR